MSNTHPHRNPDATVAHARGRVMDIRNVPSKWSTYDGPLAFHSVKELCGTLPWFAFVDGQPRLTLDLGYPIIDCHLHLANNYFLARPIDYWRRSGNSRTFVPYEGLGVNTSVYAGQDIAEQGHAPRVVKEFVQQAVSSKGGGMAHHSAANCLRDMDNMGIGHSVVLCIDLPFVSRNTDHVLKVYEQTDRLLPFVSLHPLDPAWRRKAERYVDAGAVGLKIHPEVQQVAIDSKRWEPILSFWRETKLPILSHTSVSPIQPETVTGGDTVPRSCLSRVEKVLEKFPEIPFLIGHAGMNDYRNTIRLVNRFPNVYAELDGQPPKHLYDFFDQVDHSRLVWGTDWPVYPQAYQLARFLAATEGQDELRYRVLHENAARVLGLATVPLKRPRKQASAKQAPVAVGV